ARARLAGQPVRRRALVAHEEDGVGVDGARRAPERGQTPLVEELRDGAAGGALGQHDVAEAGRALVARPLVQLVEEAARLRCRAGGSEPADDRALLDGAREDGETAAAAHVGAVPADERIAKVGVAAAGPP